MPPTKEDCIGGVMVFAVFSHKEITLVVGDPMYLIWGLVGFIGIFGDNFIFILGCLMNKKNMSPFFLVAFSF